LPGRRSDVGPRDPNPTCALQFGSVRRGDENNSGIDSESRSPQNCDETADDPAEREYRKCSGEHERTWHCSSPVFIDTDAGRSVATATKSSSGMRPTAEGLPVR
jgi:hypothetical protein